MSGQLRTRRDVWALSAQNPWHPTILAYARAVRAMQARPRTAPASWIYQAAIHGSVDTPPRGARWNQCQHGSWFFLPWHRLYVEQFERIVRAAVVQAGGPADWALPYWNFEAAGADSLPPAFRATTLPDGTANPLFVAQRAPGINTGGRLPVARLASRTALAERTFSPPPGAGFGGGRSGPMQFASAYGTVERTPHNDIHVLVGGTGLMGDPNRAALDPIFWLHHANIDRLWSQWTALGQGRANPTDRAWTGQRFPFVDERGTVVQRTVAQSVSTAVLGYTYDTLPAPVRTGPAAASGQEKALRTEVAMELMGASDAPVDLVGATAGVDVPIDRKATALFAAAAPAVAAAGTPAPRRVYVAVEDIVGDVNPGTVYEVHLVSTRRAANQPVPDRYIGNLSFFGIERAKRADDHGTHGMRHVYDVTDLVDRLQAGGAWDDDGVRVEFRPMGLLEPAGGTPKDSPMEATAKAGPNAAPVRIGRVALFFE